MSTAPDIKAIRDSLGWNQDHMAEYLGLDRSSISRMENGQPIKGPSLKLLEALAKLDPASVPRPVLATAEASS